MTDAEKQIIAFARQHRIKLRWKGIAATGDMDASMDNYLVELYILQEGKPKRYRLKYSKGSGFHGKPPELAEVLACIACDAPYADMDFTEFCGELGYDEDSRKAHRNWQQTKRQRDKFVEFAGQEAFDQLQVLESL